MGSIGLGALVASALVVYLAWTTLERRRSRRVAARAVQVAELGDELVPVSLHPDVDPQRCIGSGSCVSACPEREVLGLVDGRVVLANPLACVGHGACLSACPVGAIRLVFGTARRGVELPRLGPDFQTSQPGVYVVGELGGMGLIRNAVAQGRQAAEVIARSGRRGGPGALDALVVGAGPAGIAATLGLMERGLRVLLVDQHDFGGTIRHYPRAKVTMTGALELPMFGTVKRRQLSKEQLLALWEDIRARVALPFERGVRVDDVRPDGAAGWLVRAGAWERRAANVVLALGRRGSPQRLDVPGADLAKVHDRLLEPEPFAGRHVLVVGGGNAAAESALALADSGRCASVTLSYRRAAFARLRAPVEARLDAAIAAGRVITRMATTVASIGERDVELVGEGGRRERLANDAVIVQIGGSAPGELLARIGVAVEEKRGAA